MGIQFRMFLRLLFIGCAVSAIEQAPYTVLKEHSGWEEREFSPMKWISVDGVSSAPNDESSQYFFRLFNYIDGQNAEQMKIDMTAPVSFRIDRESGNFTMSFFIPQSLQENPPLPNDKDLYIEERPGMRVAARRFGGYPNQQEFMKKAFELHDLAAAVGLQLVEDSYWTAGYSAPFQIVLRRNEVWLEF